MRVHKTEGFAGSQNGLVYSELAEQLAVAFDNGNWQWVRPGEFNDKFEALPEESDATGCDAIRAVLIGKKGPLSLCSGFLVSRDTSSCKPTPQGWEAFDVYCPAPIDSCPASYATPPVDFRLAIGT
eukprot:4168650-Pleurochrysis_carterae.AAC.1